MSTMATATYDGRKAERELGFKPKITVADGMRRVESWLRDPRGLTGKLLYVLLLFPYTPSPDPRRPALGPLERSRSLARDFAL